MKRILIVCTAGVSLAVASPGWALADGPVPSSCQAVDRQTCSFTVTTSGPAEAVGTGWWVVKITRGRYHINVSAVLPTDPTTASRQVVRTLDLLAGDVVSVSSQTNDSEVAVVELPVTPAVSLPVTPPGVPAVPTVPKAPSKIPPVPVTPPSVP
ncbi:MAG: hypothetical protein ACYDAY_10630 [Candidatus Dormibacteria bacterium]